MDISAVSVYENISDTEDCSESAFYQAVNNILSVTTINGKKIFCPLCVKIFEFKFTLLDHLKNIHYHFLRSTTEKSFMYEQCPFCYANFFGRHTIIKHVLKVHSKLVTQLYLQVERDSTPELNKCVFCSGIYNKKGDIEFVAHIEQKHFLQFTELYEEQFMKVNESLLSAKIDKSNPPPKVNAHNLSADSETFKQNFDFSNWKEQLHNIQCNNSDLKSILKSSKTKVHVPFPCKQTRACRVLQFDLPDENKENSVLTHNIQSEKLLTLAEHSLLCTGKIKELLKDVPGSSTLGIKPIHCSTPKHNACRKDHTGTPHRKVRIQQKRKLKLKKTATFRSYLFSDFVFQCGKCKKPFQENLELHSHIKKQHKLFILNLLHPCYQCAICEAKFFKNYYLKKHMILHTGYR